MYKILIIFCFTAVTLAEVCPPNEDVGEQRLRDRLPHTVSPIWYNITLQPDFDSLTFNGSVDIQIKFIEKSDEIVLHANLSLTKEDINIICSTTGNLSIETASINKNNSFLTIKLNNPVLKDEICHLHFKNFMGNLTETEMSGLYLAKYTENKIEKMFATTQFQQTGARRAFPCFDEPHFKATFDINLIRNENYITISNEELIETIDLGEGMFRDVYKETRLMSTYLLAFIITDYSATQVKQGQRVFGITTSIEKGDAQFSLDTGIEVLSAFEKYTEFRYTFSKIDQIAIPDAHFSPGAMENWGLVTYRTSYLVYPYKDQNTKGFQRTVSIIAHEYAHQWFGNLVTCKWWDHLWLNEGFANYFGHFGPAMVGWDLRNMYVMDAVHSALKLDSKDSTKPMNHEAAASIIVYQKAGSVIRMMSHFVTEDIFQKSLILYLKDNQYGSTTPTELYNAFDVVLGKENKTNLIGKKKLAEIMTTWDSQPGYPVLEITKTTDKIVVKQNRFLTINTINDNSMWTIPLTYVIEEDSDFSDTTADTWMTDSEMTIDKGTNGWVVFNKQQTGYYRVMYDSDNWNLIAQQLSDKDHTQIHVLNRAQLIDDSFAFVEVDRLNYSQAFELTKYLVKENEYVPIAVFLKAISEVNTKLAEENGRENYLFYMEHLLSGSPLDSVDFTESETDTIESKYLRIELINWLCKLGNERCTSYALEAFNNMQGSITPDLQEPLYCGAMRIGDQDHWKNLFEKLKEQEITEQLRNRIINGLGCSENSDILEQYINEMLIPSNNIDLLTGFRSILNAGDFGIQFVLNYTSSNFSKIETNPSAKNIILELAAKLNSEKQEDQFNALADKHSNLKDFQETFDEGKEFIKENREWNEKYGSAVNTWFTEFHKFRNNAFVCKANLSLLFGTILAIFAINFV